MLENKTIAIMQPYFLPYIGYWQLIHAVDEFVIYDNIQYTKKGWINRNRYLLNGKDRYFTLPLKKDSDYLDIRQRCLSDEIGTESKGILRRLESAYKNAPYYAEVKQLLELCFIQNDQNLFNFIFNSIQFVIQYLQINTKIIISSQVDIDHSLKNKDRVVALCKSLGSNHYINLSGGIDLYDKNDFHREGIVLSFLKPRPFEYKQYNNEFIPWLSIIDVLMFNAPDQINRILENYETF